MPCPSHPIYLITLKISDDKKKLRPVAKLSNSKWWGFTENFLICQSVKKFPAFKEFQDLHWTLSTGSSCNPCRNTKPLVSFINTVHFTKRVVIPTSNPVVGRPPCRLHLNVYRTYFHQVLRTISPVLNLRTCHAAKASEPLNMVKISARKCLKSSERRSTGLHST
jgi:hypothetical protein